MRLKKEKTDLDYQETKRFFENRAKKFREDNPYSVTMYQDNNKGLVEERNKKEVEKLKPYLKLTDKSDVLDIACGIGRWADVIPESINEYCGIDFSQELIDIANKRNRKKNFSFCTGGMNQLEDVLKENKYGRFNTVLSMGILMYINDIDIENCLEQVEHCCQEHAIICIREPIGLEARLTLKDFFSEELDTNYNAIYRTKEELEDIFKEKFIKKGFTIKEKGFLFEEDSLNNRKETAQYYYVFER